MNYANEVLNTKWKYPYGPLHKLADSNDLAKLRPQLKAKIPIIQALIKRSTHFTMPDDLIFNNAPFSHGRVWDGGMLDEGVNLPYPFITISARSERTKVFTLYQELRPQNNEGYKEWGMMTFVCMPEDSPQWRMPIAMVRIWQDPAVMTPSKTHGVVNYIAPITTKLITTNPECQETAAKEIVSYHEFELLMLFNLLTVLHNQPQTAIATTNNKVLYKTKSMNHGRIATKKHEYKELVINNHYTPTRSGVSIPTGVTQRAHTRRGHERHYKNGKVIWFYIYRAGNASKGTINKDYRVEA
jgi:hypothetical protein